MDWPSHLDPFLYPYYQDSFNCDLEAKGDLKCRVLQVDRTNEVTSAEFHLVENFEHSDGKFWDRLLNDWKVLDEDERVVPSKLPANRVCILFIPRTKDVEVSGDRVTEADLTDIPIRKEIWGKISKAFCLLPGHIVKAIIRKTTSVTSIPRRLRYVDYGDIEDNVLMHVVTTSVPGPDTFAMASTHVYRTNLTFAIMFGCSVDQMERVEELLQASEDAVKHPLLMLGICAELQLDRLEKFVNEKVKNCLQTTRLLEAIGPRDAELPQAAELPQDAKLPQDAREQKKEITWELINKVRSCRDESKRVEEEVRATQRQLSKVVRSWNERSENGNGNGNNKNGSARTDAGDFSTSGGEHQPDTDDEVENMFSERFTDILAQFEALIAECRISVEEMSFTADVIRSELARQEAQNSAQEAKNSAQEAKASTTIAFVAMLYLPMTTTATIFAMPVFQFSNNWRNWQYKAVGESSLPVFSGYFWIYLGISISLTLVTIGVWRQFTSLVSLWHKILRYIKNGVTWLSAPGSRKLPGKAVQPTAVAMPQNSLPSPQKQLASQAPSQTTAPTNASMVNTGGNITDRVNPSKCKEGIPSTNLQPAVSGNSPNMRGGRGGKAYRFASLCDMV